MNLLQCPNTGELVLTNNLQGYEDWPVLASNVPMPGVDDIWNGTGWVFSQSHRDARIARQAASNPASAIQDILARLQTLEGASIAWSAVSGKPPVFPPEYHEHGIADVDGLAEALAGKAAVGSDVWTYLRLADDFVTSSATAVDVTGLSFTPSANARYEFEAMLLLRTATTTVGPRPGVAWATGLTDGIVMIDTSSSATARLLTNGNINAAVLAPVGGLPNTTQSWPASVRGCALAGATPTGNIRLQMASETAGTNVTVKAGSFLKYRLLP